MQPEDLKAFHDWCAYAEQRGTKDMYVPVVQMRALLDAYGQVTSENRKLKRLIRNVANAIDVRG